MSTVSGTWRGPNIVKDSSLVLYLDASAKNSYNDLVDNGTWNDMSGNNNNGTLTNGPTFSSANGGSIVFDGSNDYINIANTNLLSTNNTYIFWIKPIAKSNINTLSSNSIPSFNTNGIRLFYNTYNTSDGRLKLEVGNGSSGAVVESADNTIQNDIWQCVGFVLSKTNSLGSIYYNGSLLNQGSILTDFQTTSKITIASMFGSVTYYGSIAITQIYNRALSATEIAQNFNATRERFDL
jgi:hypothetical protein